MIQALKRNVICKIRVRLVVTLINGRLHACNVTRCAVECRLPEECCSLIAGTCHSCMPIASHRARRSSGNIDFRVPRVLPTRCRAVDSCMSDITVGQSPRRNCRRADALDASLRNSSDPERQSYSLARSRRIDYSEMQSRGNSNSKPLRA